MEASSYVPSTACVGSSREEIFFPMTLCASFMKVEGPFDTKIFKVVHSYLLEQRVASLKTHIILNFTLN